MDLQKFFTEECYTTDEERDPLRPLILKDGFVHPNPDFDYAKCREAEHVREVERRRTQYGTSFFLNFDPLFNGHQVDASEGGDEMRAEILHKLRERFLDVFTAQFSDDPPLRESFDGCLAVKLCPHAQVGFSNGEVYLWLRRLPLKEDIVIKILCALKRSLEDEPITVTYQGNEYPILFYGWGFRYY